MNTSNSSAHAQPHRFEVLDLLRGIAAFAVLLYHSKAYLGAELAPNAYLAVDLFFMLSGFVIAHNYDPKIDRGMSFTDFMVQRVIRLYPCYALAFILGFVLGAARLIQIHGYVDATGLTGAAIANAVMLPAFNHVYNDVTIFPFNGASWSLFFELVANAIYWTSFRWFSSGRVLAFFLSVSAIALVVVAITSQTVDIGMRHGETIIVLPRVVFSFFAGIGIRRFIYDAQRKRIGHVAIAINVFLLAMTFCFSFFTVNMDRVIVELICITIIYPVILTLVSSAESGSWLRVFCKFAGDTSYPVYVMQTPFMLLAAAISQLFFHTRVPALAPAIGIVQVSLTVLFAYLIDRYFELPIRQVLKNTWNKRKENAGAYLRM